MYYGAGLQPLNLNNYGYTSLNLTGGSSKNLAGTGGLTTSLNRNTTGTISGGISSGVVMPAYRFSHYVRI